jgi:hypothetical protein
MSRSLLSLIALVAVVALAEPPDAPAQPVQRAACLKACAGAPRDAQGPALLRCLEHCQSAADAGVR